MIAALVRRFLGRVEKPHRSTHDLVAGLADHDHLRGSRWRHRKGGEYRVERVVYRESTLEIEVIYASRTDAVFYSRPLTEFMDGRFTQISDASVE